MIQDTTAASARTVAQRQATIDRATAKAHEQARAGNLPTRLRRFADDPTQTVEAWTVGSRTVGGAVYIIDLVADANGIATHCECAAGTADRICWHRAAVRLAALGDLPHHTPPADWTDYGHAAD